MTTTPTIELFEQSQQADTLRFTTCGSVDDGKSTLIGRLLYESRTVFTDHLAAAKAATKNRSVLDSGEDIDYSLLLDGLKAEREQGITIDVAYRFFQTPSRKFIIADAPGHEQYTRNMATGASTASLTLILVDARKGVVTQTKRHAFISSLLGIPHCVLCVNKMDLVDYDEAVYERIKADFTSFASRLQFPDLQCIPLSALKGDNVVTRSERTPYYEGKPLLSMLESVHVGSDRNMIDLRFPVQYVVRPSQDFRGYAGTVASGILRKGDQVAVLPSGRTTRVESIVTMEGEIEEAFPPMSITVCLEDEVDVSRGDLLVHPRNQPRVARRVEAMLVWMAEDKMVEGGRYLLKHMTQTVRARIEVLRYATDVNTIRRDEARSDLGLNEIGRVVISTHRPLLYDPYSRNRTTGSFILIDPNTNATVAAGMLIHREPSDTLPAAVADWQGSSEVGPLPADEHVVTAEERADRLGQDPVTLWLTGLPGSGAGEIAHALDRKLFDAGHLSRVLDGAAMRTRLSHDLDYSRADVAEHLRRASAVAELLNRSGLIVICNFVSPTKAIRGRARDLIGEEQFLEVHVASPLEWCESRVRGSIYERARQGELRNVPGVNAPYEAPKAPALTLRPDEVGIEAAADQLLEFIRARGVLRGDA